MSKSQERKSNIRQQKWWACTTHEVCFFCAEMGLHSSGDAQFSTEMTSRQSKDEVSNQLDVEKPWWPGLPPSCQTENLWAGRKFRASRPRKSYICSQILDLHSWILTLICLHILRPNMWSWQRIGGIVIRGSIRFWSALYADNPIQVISLRMVIYDYGDCDHYSQTCLLFCLTLGMPSSLGLIKRVLLSRSNIF